MHKITVDEVSYCCDPGQTVLDVLLANNVDVAYSCRQGACQSCRVRSVDNPPPANAQVGLKPTQIKRNYFLACSCVPEQDLTIKLLAKPVFNQGQVVGKRLLSGDVLELIVHSPDTLSGFAGQFVNLRRGDGLTRSYSIANVPGTERLMEFHIRRLPEGRFSNWLHDQVELGDFIELSEPLGDCLYLPESQQQGLLLVGTGTGLAPLLGILKDALNQGHSGPIHLFHGSHSIAQLYKIDELRALAARHENLSYTPCISGDQSAPGFSQGRVNDVALATLGNLSGWSVYLCGHPGMVEAMQVSAFLKGASAANIYCDAFVTEQHAR